MKIMIKLISGSNEIPSDEEISTLKKTHINNKLDSYYEIFNNFIK